MAARLSLRDYQRDLAERLRNAEAGRSASMLGVQVDDESWLVDLKDAAEVIPVPAITPVPLTRPWFKGLANIRGNLYSVVDFPAFLQRKPVTLVEQSRLLLLGERFRLGVALLVDRSLGLRNPAQLTLREPGAGSGAGSWFRAEYTDDEGRLWKELDVSQLAQHPDFLGVGVK
jgi:twitching motility protein PilI